MGSGCRVESGCLMVGAIERTVVRFHFCRFEAWTVSFTLLSLCLSEETVNSVSHFNLVSMPGEAKDLTQGNGKKLYFTY